MKQEKTFIDDSVSILSHEEDANDEEVEDDGEDDHDPGDDAPGLPTHRIVVSLLLLLSVNLNGNCYKNARLYW